MEKVELGNATLYHGDCLEILPTLEKVDAVITDPPYETTNSEWDSIIDISEMWKLLALVTNKNSPFVFMAAQPFTSKLIMSNIKNFAYCWVWEKNLKTDNLNARRRPMRGHEDVVIFYDDQPEYFPQKRKRTTEVKSGNTKNSKTSVYGKQKGDYIDRQSDYLMPDSVIKGIKCVHNSSGKVHPNQKPVELMEYFIRTYTSPGRKVLDIAMGSGTTGVACMNLGRKFIGIEIEKKYFDIACERIEQAQKQVRMFV